MDTIQLYRNMATSHRMCDLLRTSNFKPKEAEKKHKRPVFDPTQDMQDLMAINRFLNRIGEDEWPLGKKGLLSVEDAGMLIQLMRDGKGGLIVWELLSFQPVGLVKADDTISDYRIFVLALLCRFENKDRCAELKLVGTQEGRKSEASCYWSNLQQTAFHSIHSSKILAHSPALFLFVHYCEQISKQTTRQHTGWGRSMRKTIQQWYLSRTPDNLFHEITTYSASYYGFSHKDLLRLAHPNPAKTKAKSLTYTYDLIFRFISRGNIDIDNHFAEALCSMNPPEYEVTPEMVFTALGTNAITHLAELSKDIVEIEEDDTVPMEVIESAE